MEKNTTHDVSVDLNRVPSASEKVPKKIIKPKVITVIIAVIVAILVVAAVAILVALSLTHTGLFSTTKSTSSTNTISGSSTTISVISSTTISTTIATTTVGLSQCSSYTTITDATRLQTAAGGSVCDSSIFSSTPTWIRFSGAAGSQLATSAPGLNKCGTQATGWYSSSLPSSGATVNSTVCYQWSANTCNWSNTIRVTNCGSFYVFALIIPPACNARYCTA